MVSRAHLRLTLAAAVRSRSLKLAALTCCGALTLGLTCRHVGWDLTLQSVTCLPADSGPADTAASCAEPLSWVTEGAAYYSVDTLHLLVVTQGEEGANLILQPTGDDDADTK